MNLLKKNIHMHRIRSEAMTQITLEDDRNIPENKPDVNTINLEKARVVIDEIKPGTDVVNIKGCLHCKQPFSLFLNSIVINQTAF